MTWKLGELTVSRIGFGAMRLPGPPFGTVSGDRDQAMAVLRRARELGVDLVDTAAFYFTPLLSANELINSTLAPYADDLVIATKVGPGRDPGGEWYSARPDQLRGQVEQNLRELGRDHLDLVYLRRMSQTSISDHFGALAELRTAGLIRELGVSSVTSEHLTENLAAGALRLTEQDLRRLDAARLPFRHRGRAGLRERNTGVPATADRRHRRRHVHRRVRLRDVRRRVRRAGQRRAARHPAVGVMDLRVGAVRVRVLERDRAALTNGRPLTHTSAARQRAGTPVSAPAASP